MAEEVLEAPLVMPEAPVKSLREVRATPANLRRHGSPMNSGEKPFRYAFHPTWRAQIGSFTAAFVTSLLSVVISKYVPWLVIEGKILSLGSGAYIFHFPILVVLPAIFLCRAVIRVFDCSYFIDEQGVEAHVGILSTTLRQPRLRFEDIRGVEPTQSLTQRILGIGDLEIGSAMRDDVEIIMEGVDNPRALQLFINGEIERRLGEAGKRRFDD